MPNKGPERPMGVPRRRVDAGSKQFYLPLSTIVDQPAKNLQVLKTCEY
jgi:hypothetical protein